MRTITFIAATATLAVAGCGDNGTERQSADTGVPATDTAADANADTPDRANMGAPMMGDGELGSDAVMQGEWISKQMAGAPAALFGEPDTEAAFSVRCAGNELVFSRSALVEGGGTVEMALMAGGETRRIDARAQEDPLPQVTGRLSAGDPFADILARTTEPIAVAVAGGSAYGMPASEAMRRVVANCRS